MIMEPTATFCTASYIIDNKHDISLANLSLYAKLAQLQTGLGFSTSVDVYEATSRVFPIKCITTIVRAVDPWIQLCDIFLSSASPSCCLLLIVMVVKITHERQVTRNTHNHAVQGHPAVRGEVLEERHQILETAIPVTQKQHHPYQIKYSYHCAGQVIGHMENLRKDMEKWRKRYGLELCLMMRYTIIWSALVLWTSSLRSKIFKMFAKI